MKSYYFFLERNNETVDKKKEKKYIQKHLMIRESHLIALLSIRIIYRNSC